MKQYSKSVVIVLAILCVVLFCVSFFGLHTAYGDITTDIINGVHLVPEGFDVAGSAMIFMTASGTEEETPEIDYSNAKRILEERLVLSSVPEHEVYAMPENNGFAVRIPYDRYTPDNMASIRRVLINDGLFEFRTGAKDDDGNPTGDVILTNRHIKSAEVMVDASGTSYVYIVSVKLTSEGRRLLRNAADEMMNSEDSSLGFSCWINGSQVDTYTAAAMSGASTISVTRSNGYSLSTAAETATILRAGALGNTFSITAVNIDEADGVAGANSSTMIAVAFAVSVLAIGILLIIKYRVVGLCSLFAMLGSFSVMLFVLTNFGGRAYSRTVSLASLGAFFAMLFVNFLIARRDAESVRASLEESSFQKAVVDGLSKNTVSSAVIYGALFVIGLLMFDLFNRSGGWIVTAIRWVIPTFGVANYTQLSEFGILLFTGAISGFLFMSLANGLMVRSTLGFKGLAKETNYGGTENAAK